jgi:NTE family protein
VAFLEIAGLIIGIVCKNEPRIYRRQFRMPKHYTESFTGCCCTERHFILTAHQGGTPTVFYFCTRSVTLQKNKSLTEYAALNIFSYTRRLAVFASVMLFADTLAAQSSETLRLELDTLALPQKRYVIAPYKQPNRKTLSLALSGGGARGISQVGILKAFDEYHVPIDFIVGTSMGAIVGGLYATGYNAMRLEELCKVLPWNELTALQTSVERQNLFLEQKRVRDRASLTLQFDRLKLIIPQSFSSAQPLTQILDSLAMAAPYHAIENFNSLPISFRAVATDLVTGNKVVLNGGSLSQSLRASAGVPLLFSPVEIDGKELVDGGLVANIAVDVAKTETDKVVALNTVGTLYKSAQDVSLPWKAADQIMGIMMQAQNDEQLRKADIVISPNNGTRESADFSNISRIIMAGYKVGVEAVDSIRAAIHIPQSNDVSIAGYERTLVCPFLADSLRAHVMAQNHYAKETLAALMETGYFTDGFVDVNPAKQEATFHLTAMPVFRHIHINGGVAFSEERLQKLFAPILGKNYTHRSGTAALENAINELRLAGYALAQLTHVHVEQDTLHLTIDAGIIDTIEYRQSRGWTRRGVMTREVALREGQALNISDFCNSQNGLFNAGIFNRVSMWSESYREKGTVKHKLIVRCEERFSEFLRIGFRLDDVYASQLLVDFRNENFLGTASEFGGWTAFGNRNFIGQVEYRVHRFLDSYITLFTRGFFEQRELNQTRIRFSAPNVLPDRLGQDVYAQQFYGVSAALGGQLFHDGTISAEYILQNAQVFSLSSGNPPSENLNIATLRTRFTIDTRDNPASPTSGNYTDVFFDFSPEFLGNKVPFSKLSFQHQETRSFTNALVGRLRVALGFADNLTPFSQQFNLGGVASPYSNTFYGLRLDDFRGRQLMAAGYELQFQIPLQLVVPTSLSLHYNIGNTWSQASQISIRDFVHGVGAELMLRTPIGPARVVIAKPFTFGRDLSTTFFRVGPTIYYFVLGYEF